MPLFVLYTNLPKDKIPEDFLPKTSAFLAKQLEKPESKVTVRVNADQMMITAGSADPCAIVEINNITDGAKNKDTAMAITNFVETNLPLPQNRFYIIFTNQRGQNVSFEGKTIE
ncbi:macrophage migration inhibitory factor homolog [Crassostrea virginica]